MALRQLPSGRWQAVVSIRVDGRIRRVTATADSAPKMSTYVLTCPLLSLSVHAMDLPTDQLLTIEQVAERCQVSTKTVRRWIALDLIAATRLGDRSVRVTAAAVDDFIQRAAS